MNFLLGVSSLLATMGQRKLVYGENDALFGCIETQQGDTPFGHVLDAGTGIHSLRWVATLREKGMKSFTAITADASMQRSVQEEADHLGVSEGNHVVIGNWFGKLDLPQDEYDVILADYLIGAIDGFSPYQQDQIIQKLTKLLRPGGRLYIVGLEPIPDHAEGAANVICKVRQVRDACILLAGHRCYREYPMDWIQRQIEAIPNLLLKETHRFPILYRFNTIARQINVGRSKFPFFPATSLEKSMKEVLDELEKEAREATKDGPVRFGFDYVVSAERIGSAMDDSCRTST